MGDKASSVYKKKATTGKFNAHASKYTPAQIQHIKNCNKDFLYYFGYCNDPKRTTSGEETKTNTAFFTFEEHEP